MSTATAEPILNAAVFMAEHGRLPHLGVDPIPPWEYRGWLLPLVQMCEMNIRGDDSRWAYHLEILATGRLPDRPIPPLRFGDAPDLMMRRSTVAKHLETWSKINGWDMGGWHDFGVLLDWFLWGLSLSREKPRYHSAAAAEKLYRTVNVEHLLRCPYDHFGQFISERKAGGFNPSAFFPTPHEVVECMVQVQFHDAAQEGRDVRHLTVCDPCLGTGRMLLHASQFSLRLYGQEIDPVVLKCALINGALYAPWMAYPLPDALFETPCPLARENEPVSLVGPIDDLIPVPAVPDAPVIAEGLLALPAPERTIESGPTVEPIIPPKRRKREDAGQLTLF